MYEIIITVTNDETSFPLGLRLLNWMDTGFLEAHEDPLNGSQQCLLWKLTTQREQTFFHVYGLRCIGKWGDAIGLIHSETTEDWNAIGYRSRPPL